jgi:hypothetical protein
MVATGRRLLLQVRCAIYNGVFGSGFGTPFEPSQYPIRPSNHHLLLDPANGSGHSQSRFFESRRIPGGTIKNGNAGEENIWHCKKSRHSPAWWLLQ